MSKVSSAEDKRGDEMNKEDTESLKLHKRTAILVSSQLISQAIIYWQEKAATKNVPDKEDVLFKSKIFLSFTLVLWGICVCTHQQMELEHRVEEWPKVSAMAHMKDKH